MSREQGIGTVTSNVDLSRRVDFFPRSVSQCAHAWRFPVVLLSVAMVGAAGCNTSSDCSISGTVTLDDQPLNDGMLMLVPEEPGMQRKAASALIENGEFAIERGKGLQPGRYRVAITAEQPSGKKIEADPGTGVMIDQYVQVVPEKYNARTELTVDITGDHDDLNYELTRK